MSNKRKIIGKKSFIMASTAVALTGMAGVYGMDVAQAAPSASSTASTPTASASSSSTQTAPKVAVVDKVAAVANGANTNTTTTTVVNISSENTQQNIGGAYVKQLAHGLYAGNANMIGFKWASRTGDVVVQFRSFFNNQWSAWQTVANDDATTSGASTAGSTDPVNFVSSSQVEMRAYTQNSGTIDNLQATVIYAPTTTADATKASADGATKANVEAVAVKPVVATPKVAVMSPYTYATPPAIISRNGWGASAALLSMNGSGCTKPVYNDTMKAVVIHHTDTSNSYTAAQSASIVRGIYNYHVVSNKWCDIGYNFLVDKYGQIFQGRNGDTSFAIQGAHAYQWNPETNGIAMLMNSMNAKMSASGQNSLAKLVAWRMAGFYIDPNAKVHLVNNNYPTIMRHGDVIKNTVCPGTNITADMPAIRALVTKDMGNWKTPIYQTWKSLGGETGTLGSVHQMEHAYAGGRLTVFAKGAAVQNPGTTNVHWMTSAVYNAWMANGGAGKLGFPTTSLIPGSIRGSAIMTFSKGYSLVTGVGGVKLSKPAVANAWFSSRSNTVGLGFPTANYYMSGTNTVEKFQHGSIVVPAKENAKITIS